MDSPGFNDEKYQKLVEKQYQNFDTIPYLD